jgi:hypothetical protein
MKVALPAFLLKASRKRRRNPVRDDVEEAARLFRRFTGHEPRYVDTVDAQPMPKALTAIGKCDGILYSAVRDGKLERYIHEFSRKSRPTFAVSPDGKQLYLLGGAYNFTSRGIVDKR